MFIEIRKRGKNKKYYLVHSYREKDKVKRISRYLGSNLNEKRLLELKRVAEQHILEELKERNILEFELTKKEIEEFKKYEKDIEIKHLQALNWKRFTENFTYNTNVIEGLTVALPEVKELLSRKEKPRDADDIETLNCNNIFNPLYFIDYILNLFSNLCSLRYRGTRF